MRARYEKASKIFNGCHVLLKRDSKVETEMFKARPARPLARRVSADDHQALNVPHRANLPPRRFSVSGAPLINPGQQAPTRAQALEQLGMAGLLVLDANIDGDDVAANNIELADDETTIEGVSIF